MDRFTPMDRLESLEGMHVLCALFIMGALVGGCAAPTPDGACTPATDTASIPVQPGSFPEPPGIRLLVSGASAAPVTTMSVEATRRDDRTRYSFTYRWSDPSAPHEVKLTTTLGRYDVVAWAPGYAPRSSSSDVTDEDSWSSMELRLVPAVGTEQLPPIEASACSGILEGSVTVGGAPAQTGTSVTVIGSSRGRVIPVVGGRFRVTLPVGPYSVAWEYGIPSPPITVAANSTTHVALDV